MPMVVPALFLVLVLPAWETCFLELCFFYFRGGSQGGGGVHGRFVRHTLAGPLITRAWKRAGNAAEIAPSRKTWGKMGPTVRVLQCFVEKWGQHCVKSPQNHFFYPWGGVGGVY